MVARGFSASAIERCRLGIAMEHRNITIKWQVFFSLLSYFCGEKVEKSLGVIMCAKGVPFASHRLPRRQPHKKSWNQRYL
jgi:hypothetical protein